MQFILNLIDISRRLADIPKEQRNQALKAELNLLNLHLPALICIPTWCEASENCSSHDQLLRIAVSEALILDSAQKCPFFVPIEMLSANNREDNESLDLSYMPLDTSHQKVDQIAIDASEICTIKPIETELLKSAALMILQLSKIKHSDKNVNQEEVNKIYKNIILSIENDNNGDNGNSSGNKSANLSDLVHLENLEQKRDKIKRESPYGSLPNWKLLPLIVKSGSEMRQELFVSQFIALVSEIWEKQDLKLWLYPFKVLATIKGGGLIELIKGAKSLHSIKKNFNITSGFTLRNFFIKNFGSPDHQRFISARQNFVNSLAGYSLITYLLQLKDRHNGNILIDNHGHLIHIDFDFIFAKVPGYYYGFETAPFKMTHEYMDLMGGPGSELFASFCDLLFKGLLALRKYSERILLLVDIIQKKSSLDCFHSHTEENQEYKSTKKFLQERLHLNLTELQLREYVTQIVNLSSNNAFTALYDLYQYYSNGIIP